MGGGGVRCEPTDETREEDLPIKHEYASWVGLRKQFFPGIPKRFEELANKSL